MADYTITMKTEDTTIPIGQATSQEEAQAIADDWNRRYGTTDPRMGDHAVVRPA